MSGRVMSLTVRQLCKETNRRAKKVLFLFPQENKTGIAPTRVIIEKDVDLTEGQLVHVNWGGKKVPAEILAVNGKFITYIALFLCQFYTVQL